MFLNCQASLRIEYLPQVSYIGDRAIKANILSSVKEGCGKNCFGGVG
jgi:hypothetical protein